MDIEKVYKEKKAELETMNTQQAVRLEKIKQIAGEFGFEVNQSLSENVSKIRTKRLAKKADLESEIAVIAEKLEKSGVS